ncbi:iron ABC transporter permease [Bacillus cereus]|nr:hypothetical protein BACI_c45200 [Bacillus cereus biovar anthracis str. CI]EEK42904.1 Iron compound ABC transporter, permease [Bacillus cereus m1293]MBE7116509.1 iron ABC transporter permease [Bacillus paranthracis]OOZ80304.1 iron ABC transporter permease [Bacillus cereus]OUA67108.1 iron ABC transporter permease [Bacillus thuringiensis serovar thailandensis]PNS31616.1 iron ABC transporter permease [Bacillus sp. AKBS9]
MQFALLLLVLSPHLHRLLTIHISLCIGTIAYPKEIPSSLVVAVIGAPYFSCLMRKSEKKVN